MMKNAVEPSTAAQRIHNLRDDEVGDFVKRSIAEHRLSPMMKELNAAVLSENPGRRADAEAALARIGFL